MNIFKSKGNFCMWNRDIYLFFKTGLMLKHWYAADMLKHWTTKATNTAITLKKDYFPRGLNWVLRRNHLQDSDKQVERTLTYLNKQSQTGCADRHNLIKAEEKHRLCFQMSTCSLYSPTYCESAILWRRSRFQLKRFGHSTAHYEPLTL